MYIPELKVQVIENRVHVLVGDASVGSFEDFDKAYKAIGHLKFHFQVAYAESDRLDFKQGYEDGFKDGREEGYNDGWDNAIERGENAS